jgi:nucleotide-binding universal stress UspA family protein
MKRILVYVDGTEESVTAAQYAIILSRSTGAELTALYVVNTRALDDLVKSRIFLKSEEEEYKIDLERDAERYLNHVRHLAREKGVVLKTIHTSGSVKVEIKKQVSELDIDLLVIGELSRIRSRRDEFFNEAERAMRSVDCPVLVVKNNEEIWNLYENFR